MDTTQLLRGVLDLAVLAVVEQEDGYGYDVLRRLRAAGLSDVQLIELPLLAGHYEMLAMTLNALRVPPDRFRDRGGLRVLERLR